jgi:hypothetical protein
MAKKKIISDQVFYKDRWVDRKTFRAYVYNEKDKKLANSYKEYETLIASGLWFSNKEKIPKIENVDSPKIVKIRKSKHGANG